MTMTASIGAVLLTCTISGPFAVAAESPYMQDFEFLESTIAQKGAAVAFKKIDWKEECARLRPKFEACKDDAEHLTNVMELLARLRDSHTDLWDSKVDRSKLPSKWKGQYGGGLWLGYDAGRFWIQGVVANHPAGPQLAAGSLLLAVDDEPAWYAMERARRRISRHSGISADHSLFASLSNAALPLGDRTHATIAFLTLDGNRRESKVARYGPDGKPFRYDLATLPEGVESSEHAVAKLLTTKRFPKLGYLRITGSQDEATVKAFHAAFDTLKGMEALVLDGRGMGGGSDLCAWEMVGRLLPKGADNGRNGRIEPAGSWQFDGPVVFLQDELMVSSAETFAWAVVETDRAVSVGRSTGGWGIVPNVFDLPSGLGKVRIGVNARPTPIRKVQTEGVGWPADLAVPYGPLISAQRDPVYDIALEVLAVVASGVPVTEARKLFGALGSYELDAFAKAAAKHAKVVGFDARSLAKQWRDDLEGALAIEKVALQEEQTPPDFAGAERRVANLVERATKAGLAGAAKTIQSLLKSKSAEIAAQRAYLEAANDALELDDAARQAFRKKHGKTGFAKWVDARHAKRGT